MANLEMIAVNLRLRALRGGQQRKVHWAARRHGSGHDKLQEIPATGSHSASPSSGEGSKGATGSSACALRVRRRYQINMVLIEKSRINVAMALISGVIPRRSRDQISSGSVLSRPIRKKLTAISSSESVKISNPAAINETLK